MERIHYIKSGNDVKSGEAYLIARQCQSLQASIAESYGYEPELIVLDGAETSASQLAGSLETGGLFSSARIVLWRNPTLLKSAAKNSEASEEEILGLLDSLLQEANSDCTLVVTNYKEKAPPFKKKAKKKQAPGKGAGPSKAGGLEKWLQQNARVHDLQPLAVADMEAWAAEELAARGLGRDHQVISDLIKSGQDMYYLITLLDKMALMTGGKPLKSEDLANDLENRQEPSVFKLLDELRARNAVTALNMLGNLLEQGESPIGVVAMMAWDLKQFGRIKALKEQDLPMADIARITRLQSWQVTRYARNAGHFTWREIEDLDRQLLDADIAMKNSSRNERILLETLVVKYGKVRRQ